MRCDRKLWEASVGMRELKVFVGVDGVSLSHSFGLKILKILLFFWSFSPGQVVCHWTCLCNTAGGK